MHDYDALLAEAEQRETFEFTVKGQEFALRHRGALTRSQLTELAVADPYKTVQILLDDPADAERFEALDLPAMVISDPWDAQFPERGILADYQRFAGITPGESPASARSYPRTSKRSRPTSAAGTPSTSPTQSGKSRGGASSR